MWGGFLRLSIELRALRGYLFKPVFIRVAPPYLVVALSSDNASAYEDLSLLIDVDYDAIGILGVVFGLRPCVVGV